MEVIKYLMLQIEQLKEKHLEIKTNEGKKKQKILKQQQFIRRLQKEMIQCGASSEFIQEIMNKIMYGVDKDKNGIIEKIDTLPVVKKLTLSQMFKDFQQNQHDSSILSKSVKEQIKILEEVSTQQKLAHLHEQKTKIQCKQIDNEIQALQSLITATRKSIKPQNLKPKPLPPKQTTIQEQRQHQIQHIKQIRKKFYGKKNKKYLQSILTEDNPQNEFTQTQNPQNQFIENQRQSKIEINDNNNEELKSSTKQLYKTQNLSDYSQNQSQKEDVEMFGVSTVLGTNFSDSKLFAGNYELWKLTGLSILLQSSTIVGIKAQYNYKQQGNWHIAKNKKALSPNFSEEQFVCFEQQMIISLSGTFCGGVLINLTALTNMNRYHRFGLVQNRKKEEVLEFDLCSDSDSRPLYIIGRICASGICRLGAKIVIQNREEDSSSRQN